MQNKIKVFCGRAQRGDRTAEDGRKTERSSAPYAEAYSPRSVIYVWTNKKKKKKPAVLIFNGLVELRVVDQFAFAHPLQAMH